ncbi:MAG TPA: DNA polymerase ligase N-terminal domain-containing protein, partial [Gammaproteobacteria bacterium]|nr:DNA polymerase ligase N-terminal domain-containing protein [Gammaproteobacteria bacterium]
PKGPSTDPREKRLAVPTEDHPLDYADFEGVIPEGEYGAGPVIVWDTGPYENLTEKNGRIQSMAKAIKNGHVLVSLKGKKLKGGYALQRTGKGGDARWLLIKMRDDEADARRNPVSTEPESVKSGRSVDQMRRKGARRK